MSELNASKAREIARNPDPTCESYDLAEARGFMTCHALAERVLVKALEGIEKNCVASTWARDLAEDALTNGE